jgi:hypothetical protein
MATSGNAAGFHPAGHVFQIGREYFETANRPAFGIIRYCGKDLSGPDIDTSRLRLNDWFVVHGLSSMVCRPWFVVHGYSASASVLFLRCHRNAPLVGMPAAAESQMQGTLLKGIRPKREMPRL